jgi:hypothetical protein
MEEGVSRSSSLVDTCQILPLHASRVFSPVSRKEGSRFTVGCVSFRLREGSSCQTIQSKSASWPIF